MCGIVKVKIQPIFPGMTIIQQYVMLRGEAGGEREGKREREKKGERALSILQKIEMLLQKAQFKIKCLYQEAIQ